MKIKKLLSLFSAAAISASCFAGMAVTASAEEAANDDYVEWTVLGTTHKNSVDSLYENPVQHKNTLTEQPTFAFILGEDNKVNECQNYKAAADYTFTKFSNESMTVASNPGASMHAIKLGTATKGGIKISNILPDGCDYESYDIKVVYSLRYSGNQGIQIIYDAGEPSKQQFENGSDPNVQTYTVKEFDVEDVKSPSITLARTNSEVELLYVGIKYKVRTGAVTYSINCKNDVEAVSYNGGTVTIGDNLTSAKEGTPITVIPTPYANFEIGEVKYGNGSDYTTITPQDGVYSFNMPAHSVTVTATFNYNNSDSVLKYFGQASSIDKAKKDENQGAYCLNYVQRGASATFNDVEYTKDGKVLSSVTVLTSNNNASDINVTFNDDETSKQSLDVNTDWSQAVGTYYTYHAKTVPFTAKPTGDKTLKITIDSTTPLNDEKTNTYIGNYWMLVLNYTTPAPELEGTDATVEMATDKAGKHAAAAYATVKISDLNNKTLKWSITASNGDQSDTQTTEAKYVDGAFSGDGSAVLGLLVSGIPDSAKIDSAKIILE